MEGIKKVSMMYILVGILAMVAMASMEEDEKECADEVTKLAACIPYVSGTAKKPTPECCEDTQKVKSAKPKCLCVLIKQSTEPSLGLPINPSLALQMPSLCNIDAKVSDCPSILKLPPDSPDAKIFKIAGADSSPSTATASPSSSGSSTSSGSDSSSKPTSDSSDGTKLCCSVLVAMGVAFAALFL